MDRNKQRDIASKGGKAAHQKGTAHEWTSEEAREAGRKGGMASHRRRQQQSGEESDPGSTSGAGSSSKAGEDMSGFSRSGAADDRGMSDGRSDIETMSVPDRNEYH